MTVLSFAATATIGALRYAGNLAEVRVTSAVGPGVGSAQLVLPRDLRVDARPGDDVSVMLAGESGAQTPAFTGTVLAVVRDVDRTTVSCGDASAALARVRPGSTFEQQGAAAIVRSLAQEAGVDVGTLDLDVDLPAYLAHQGRTAWEHVTTLAGWGGCLATCDADGAVVVRPFPSPPVELALRYGREIAELSVSARAAGPELIPTGSGPAGSGSDPRARLQSTSTVPDDAAAPSARVIRVAAPALRTPPAAAGAGRAANRGNGAPRLSATCWLVPGLRAGGTMDIADAPADGAAGPWILTRVTHQVGPGPAGRTTLTAVGPRDDGGPGLLGRLASTVGGLL